MIYSESSSNLEKINAMTVHTENQLVRSNQHLKLDKPGGSYLKSLYYRTEMFENPKTKPLNNSKQ